MGAADWLAAAVAPERPRIDARRFAIVVAHPDDETLGCGGLLPRLDGVTLVLVTDGAPRNLEDAKAYGFATAAEYAAARAAEMAAARAIGGATGPLIRLNIPDQGAALALIELSQRLAELFADFDVILTHAYEGGHPDHDAACFAVHAAARRAGGRQVVEMPLYNADALQRFPEGDTGALVLRLTAGEQARKRAMIAAYRTQAAVLAPFGVAEERYRLTPGHDFTQLPNDGRLHYDTQPWGMTGAQWRTLASDALAQLWP